MAKAKAKSKPKPARLQLDVESGKVFKNVKSAQLRNAILGEEFAILGTGSSGGTYIQCAVQDKPPHLYILEYQEATTDRHYAAVHPGIDLAAIVATMAKYLAGDESWRTDFKWKKMKL